VERKENNALLKEIWEKRRLLKPSFVK